MWFDHASLTPTQSAHTSLFASTKAWLQSILHSANTQPSLLPSASGGKRTLWSKGQFDTAQDASRCAVWASFQIAPVGLSSDAKAPADNDKDDLVDQSRRGRRLDAPDVQPGHGILNIVHDNDMNVDLRAKNPLVDPPVVLPMVGMIHSENCQFTLNVTASALIVDRVLVEEKAMEYSMVVSLWRLAWLDDGGWDSLHTMCARRAGDHLHRGANDRVDQAADVIQHARHCWTGIAAVRGHASSDGQLHLLAAHRGGHHVGVPVQLLCDHFIQLPHAVFHTGNATDAANLEGKARGRVC